MRKQKSRSETDIDLWRRYDSGDKSALAPLLHQFKGPVSRWVSQNSSPNLPSSAVELEAWKNVMKAFDTFNPTKGASLLTHATWQMKKGSRFVGKHADVATLTEERRLMVGRYRAAQEELTEKFGRPPSLMELQEYFAADVGLTSNQKVQFNLRNLARLQKEVRRDVLPTDYGEEFGVQEHDPTESLALHTVYSSLTPRDQKIFEHKTGYMGMPVLKNVEIAKMLKVSPTTIGKRVHRFQGMLEQALV